MTKAITERITSGLHVRLVPMLVALDTDPGGGTDYTEPADPHLLQPPRVGTGGRIEA